MDRAYILAQVERWNNMSEASQHAWYRRNEITHYDNCAVCQQHINKDGTPKR